MGLAPFDKDMSPPAGQGCFTDHDPKAPKPHEGKRLLQCGVVGCSGDWGCGGHKAECPTADCPPWPAGAAKCDGKKMTPAYCAQMCLAWSPRFSYAGVAYGSECWAQWSNRGAGQ